MVNIKKIVFGIPSTRRGLGFNLVKNPYTIIKYLSRVFAADLTMTSPR
jgi:hypothetical protein